MWNWMKAIFWGLGLCLGLLLMPLIALIVSAILCVIGLWAAINIIKAMYDLENEGNEHDGTTEGRQ